MLSVLRQRSSLFGFTAPDSSDSPANLPPPFPFPKQSRRVELPSTKQQGEQNSYSKVTNRQRELVHQHSVELKANTHSDNQLFLKEIVSNVLDGLGIGWLRTNRVKKLMEDENYRNFVLSRLNVNLDRKYSSEDSHIDDVVRDSRSLHAQLHHAACRLFLFLESEPGDISRHGHDSTSGDPRSRSNIRE